MPLNTYIQHILDQQINPESSTNMSLPNIRTSLEPDCASTPSPVDSFLDDSSPIEQGWDQEESNWQDADEIKDEDRRVAALITEAYVSPTDMSLDGAADKHEEYFMSGALNDEDPRCALGEDECQVKIQKRVAAEARERGFEEERMRRFFEIEGQVQSCPIRRRSGGRGKGKWTIPAHEHEGEDEPTLSPISGSSDGAIEVEGERMKMTSRHARETKEYEDKIAASDA